jgi:hypothetical protein
MINNTKEVFEKVWSLHFSSSSLEGGKLSLICLQSYEWITVDRSEVLVSSLGLVVDSLDISNTWGKCSLFVWVLRHTGIWRQYIFTGAGKSSGALWCITSDTNELLNRTTGIRKQASRIATLKNHFRIWTQSNEGQVVRKQAYVEL